MVAFAKDTQEKVALFSTDVAEIKLVIELLCKKAKSAKPERFASINSLYKKQMRASFMRLFCCDNMDGKDRRAVMDSDDHYYHFMTFPLITAKAYKDTIEAFEIAARDSMSGLNAAMQLLAEALQESSNHIGVSSIALRMIAVEMLYHELFKQNKPALLPEIIARVSESFLAIRETPTLKITH